MGRLQVGLKPEREWGQWALAGRVMSQAACRVLQSAKLRLLQSGSVTQSLMRWG